MTNEHRVGICRKKQENPNMTQQELVAWAESEFGIRITQGTVSNTLKRSAELLTGTEGRSRDAKRHKGVKYPLMEEALFEWFQTNQERVSMGGELLKEKGAFFLREIIPLQDV